MRTVKKIVIFALLIIVMGCDGGSGSAEYKEAKKRLSSNPQEALVLYDRLLRVFPDSKYSLQASLDMLDFCPKSKVCQEAEIIFLKFILSKSSDHKQICKTLDRLSFVYFERGFYKQAIETISLLFSKEPEDIKNERRLQLAKSNYYLKNFYQAEVELEKYIGGASDEEQIVEGLSLKAEIQGAQKKYTHATKTYEQIKKEHSAIYIKKQIFLGEAIMFEEQKQVEMAIQVLETSLESAQDTAFIKAKIEKLKEQQALMPGAAGLKK